MTEQRPIITSTIRATIEYWADRQPDHPALVDTQADTEYSYRELLLTIDTFRTAIASAGLSKNARVCTVFPNGLGAAIAFLCTSSVAQSAPLNPAAISHELSRQISIIGPELLLVDQAIDLKPPGMPLESVAHAKLGLNACPLKIELSQVSGSSGTASLAEPEDVAGIMQTSGSTADPKLVPLKHRQMLTNASNFANALELSPRDRCLNIMQMHHVGGLQGTLLATLWSGGTTICTPGFIPSEFAGWLEAFQPTWFEAVPTMLNTLVNDDTNPASSFASDSLRMVRSSSAALAPRLLERVEELFGVPVIEAYGMSEAGLMAINPLDPNRRRPGSVGRIVGDSVTVVGPTGEPTDPGEVGEVVARGSFVIDSYAEGGDRSEDSFTGAGFRTGDLGFIDDDGFLTLVGRSKEMVNRGGENIGLREIDEAIELHPDVIEAAAFSLPHPALGEELYAAVVIRPGSMVRPTDLRLFLSQRLAWAKVPKRIFFEETLPVGATGKILRSRLASNYASSITADRPGSVSRDSSQAPA